MYNMLSEYSLLILVGLLSDLPQYSKNIYNANKMHFAYYSNTVDKNIPL